MSVYADCKESFKILARIASKSLADPPWFAVPVNAHEDQDSVTVYFHVPGTRQSQVRVVATDQSVTVRSRRERHSQSLMRVCALPCPVVADQIETTGVGDLLRVRMPKKRPAVDARETPPAT
jgi:HSP20 family molecular chaperone IbpA